MHQNEYLWSKGLRRMYQIILKSIHKYRSYGPDKSGRMNASMHIAHVHTPKCDYEDYVSVTSYEQSP